LIPILKLLLHIYDYLSAHRRWLWATFAVLVLCLTTLAATLRYKEDIMDFLPVDDEQRESMQVQQQLSEASRIVIIFEGSDPDSLCLAVDDYAANVESHPLHTAESSVVDVDNFTAEPDLDSYLERLRYVHAHAPYFLSDSSYLRLDTLLTPEAVTRAVMQDRSLLSMPGSGLLKGAVSSDPLRLFPLSVGASGQYAGASSAFTAYDGYMMTADQRMAFAFYDSPFGSTESSRNADLVKELQCYADITHAQYPSVDVRLLGAPVIAVGNAHRIKMDSLMAIGLSLILIIALLLYAFPRKRDLLLILLSISFGWLLGMAVLRLCVGQVSAIVLGIGSVLMGIAVNYPLHLLVHQRYTTSVRQTLQEVLSPLVVGNITTVGAFLALIPLRATALRDLGIFASSMLIGTILFCIFVLPHLMSAEPTPVREIRLFRGCSITPRLRKTGIAILVLLTITMACVPAFVNQPLFDSNLSHINYMTPQQRADFAFFDALTNKSNQPAYLASTAREELQRRLNLWNEFWQTHDSASLRVNLEEAAVQVGFREGTFAPFCEMLAADYSMDAQNELIQNDLANLWPGRFDAAALNSRMASALSDNFDYLGLCCSIIVFVFLCLSFRSFTLALIAFLPMAVSWIWIIALMQLFGLQFNIVNVILATFIFGQGDDYTIFVLEGALHKEKTGKPLLQQYVQSIILSALIMLVGIGVLIVAGHPAMYSLGAVTLIGMSCVVLMAYVLPPLLLKLVLRIPRLNSYLLSKVPDEENA